MKRNKVIIAIITLLIIIGIIFSVNTINKNIDTDKQIVDAKFNIEKINADFSNEKNRSNKINILKTIQKDSALNNSTLDDESIKNDYSESIKSMQLYFTIDYDNTLFSNSIYSEDKATIVKQIADLNTLLDTIKSEKDVVLNEVKFEEYSVKINEAIKNNTVKFKQ